MASFPAAKALSGGLLQVHDPSTIVECLKKPADRSLKASLRLLYAEPEDSNVRLAALSFNKTKEKQPYMEDKLLLFDNKYYVTQGTF